MVKSISGPLFPLIRKNRHFAEKSQFHPIRPVKAAIDVPSHHLCPLVVIGELLAKREALVLATPLPQSPPARVPSVVLAGLFSQVSGGSPHGFRAGVLHQARVLFHTSHCPHQPDERGRQQVTPQASSQGDVCHCVSSGELKTAECGAWKG